MSDDIPGPLEFLQKKFQEEKSRCEAEDVGPPKTLAEMPQRELRSVLAPLMETLSKFDRALKLIAADHAALVLSFSSDRFKRASPVIRGLAIQIIDIRISKTPLADHKLLLRIAERDLRGNRKAADLIEKARELADEWRRGLKYRARTERAFLLSLIYLELGSPRNIHRDSLWRIFCERHPDLLSEVQDERNAKSQAFSDAKLSFLEADKGGSHFR